MSTPSPTRGHFLARMRRSALALSVTPVHPQWFSFRAKNRAADAVVSAAAGDLLDIGCGDGVLRELVAGRCRYVGLDSVATGSRMYGARPDVFGDAAALPFREATFDAVCLLDVLEHLPEPRPSLCEIGRVLKPGGALYISVPCMYPLHDEPYDYQRPTLHGLRHWLEQAGFDVAIIEPRGTPVETAALLLNISLARLTLRAIRVFAPFALLLVLVAPLILLINLAGWLFGWIDRNDAFMPLAYWAVARRAVAGEKRDV